MLITEAFIFINEHLKHRPPQDLLLAVVLPFCRCTYDHIKIEFNHRIILKVKKIMILVFMLSKMLHMVSFEV